MKERKSYSKSEILSKIDKVENRIRFLERAKQEAVKHLGNNRKEIWIRNYGKKIAQYKKKPV